MGVLHLNLDLVGHSCSINHGLDKFWSWWRICGLQSLTWWQRVFSYRKSLFWWVFCNLNLYLDGHSCYINLDVDGEWIPCHLNLDLDSSFFNLDLVGKLVFCNFDLDGKRGFPILNLDPNEHFQEDLMSLEKHNKVALHVVFCIAL